ncbi:hypothetical protein Ancab_040250 [Ancistrocladus abbreviatus]
MVIGRMLFVYLFFFFSQFYFDGTWFPIFTSQIFPPPGCLVWCHLQEGASWKSGASSFAGYVLVCVVSVLWFVQVTRLNLGGCIFSLWCTRSCWSLVPMVNSIVFLGSVWAAVGVFSIFQLTGGLKDFGVFQLIVMCEFVLEFLQFLRAS